jgi:predicted DNA-binding transcriptional regulator YafY
MLIFMRADRLLSILLLLQTHRRLTAADLARRLECSERTILRDMDALSTSGIPVVADRGVGGGWRLLDGFETKLTGLKVREIQSLFLSPPPGLLADLGLKQEGELALAKLRASLPAELRAPAEFAARRILVDTRGWRDPGESVACLPVLLDALWCGRRVRFVYTGALHPAAERTVDPLGLVAKGAAWYLIATTNAGPRTYRVSRMQDAAVLEAAAPVPADFDLAAYWRNSISEFRQALPRYEATFLVQPGVIRWVKYRGWRLLDQEAHEGRNRVRLRFDAEEEALQFALSFGAELEVVEPDELRQRVIDAARAIPRLYRNTHASQHVR